MNASQFIIIKYLLQDMKTVQPFVAFVIAIIDLIAVNITQN
jgi:hypothetical protein